MVAMRKVGSNGESHISCVCVLCCLPLFRDILQLSLAFGRMSLLAPCRRPWGRFTPCLLSTSLSAVTGQVWYTRRIRSFCLQTSTSRFVYLHTKVCIVVSLLVCTVWHCVVLCGAVSASPKVCTCICSGINGDLWMDASPTWTCVGTWFCVSNANVRWGCAENQGVVTYCPGFSELPTKICTCQPWHVW